MILLTTTNNRQKLKVAYRSETSDLGSILKVVHNRTIQSSMQIIN